MENFVELTQYKMLNELSRNPKARILIVHKNSNGVLSVFEITKNTSPNILKSVLLTYDEVHIFIRENDYEQMCIDSYTKNKV